MAASAWLVPLRSAAAGEPIARDGEPIATSRYAIDLFQGPVLATARTTGLAGAYAALAEGVDGNRTNAAAPAVRRPWSRNWFHPAFAFGFTLPGILSRTDFDNDGEVGFAYEDFSFLTAGVNLTLGAWGLGLLIDAQHYALRGAGTPGEATRSLDVTLQRGHFLGARSFFDGQLVFGLGAQVASLEISAVAPADDVREGVFAMSSTRLETGILWAPERLPLRLALSGRAPGESEADPQNAVLPDTAGDTRVGPFYLPQRLELPWELELGWAVQLGRRQLNTTWQNPRQALAPLRRRIDEERAALADAADDGSGAARLRAARRSFRSERHASYVALPRQKLLISASWLLSGPVRDGVGFESFLRQTVQRSGQVATLTPRLGLEFEPIVDYLQARCGWYLEPSRFERGSPRLHGTAGLDVGLFRFDAFGLLHHGTRWRAGAYVDGANRYLAWGASAGIWH